MKKKVMSVILVIIGVVTLSSVNLNIYAKGNDGKSVRSADAEYLLSQGCPKELFESVGDEELNHLVNNLKNNQEEASITWGYEEIDNLEFIQKIINSTDQELRDQGLRDTDIKNCRDQIDDLKNKTDKELMEEFQISNSAVESVRKAFYKSDNYKRKDITVENIVTLSAALSRSKMTHGLYADRYYNSGYPVRYLIRTGFSWVTPFNFKFWDDEVAIAWEGGLCISGSDITSRAEYYKVKGIAGAYSYTDCSSGTALSKKSVTANAGMIFSTPQVRRAGLADTFLRSGYISFFIYNSKLANRYANVTSQYLHKGLGIGSLSITGGGKISGSFAAVDYLSDTDVVSIQY